MTISTISQRRREFDVDEDLNRLLSTAIVGALSRPDCQCVGLYASLVMFEPEVSANRWPSSSKAVA